MLAYLQVLLAIRREASVVYPHNGMVFFLYKPLWNIHDAGDDIGYLKKQFLGNSISESGIPRIRIDGPYLVAQNKAIRFRWAE